MDGLREGGKGVRRASLLLLRFLGRLTRWTVIQAGLRMELKNMCRSIVDVAHLQDDLCRVSSRVPELRERKRGRRHGSAVGLGGAAGLRSLRLAGGGRGELDAKRSSLCVWR